MAYIFISHTTADNEWAARLATDITALAHQVFLDEWNIRVGDGIAEQVNKGLGEADYIVVVLSPRAVESKWVEREWQSRYGDEVESGRTIILPALVERCEIPALLRGKKYANFGKNYSVALVDLMAAVAPVIRTESPAHEAGASPIPSPVPASIEVSELLGKVHRPGVRLSQCLAETLAFAQRSEIADLAAFCRQELSGWTPPGYVNEQEVPAYRLVEAFLSPFGELNMQYVGWGGSSAKALDHMRNNPDEFFPYTLFISRPVSELEAREVPNSRSGLVSIQSKHSEVLHKQVDPDLPVWIYAEGDTTDRVLQAIRTELTRRLLDLLPSLGSDDTRDTDSTPT